MHLNRLLCPFMNPVFCSYFVFPKLRLLLSLETIFLYYLLFRTFDNGLLKDTISALSNEFFEDNGIDNYKAATVKALFYKFYQRVQAALVGITSKVYLCKAVRPYSALYWPLNFTKKQFKLWQRPCLESLGCWKK